MPFKMGEIMLNKETVHISHAIGEVISLLLTYKSFCERIEKTGLSEQQKNQVRDILWDAMELTK